MPLPRHAVFNHNDQLVKYNGHNSILTLTAIAAAIAKDKAHKNVVRVGPRYVGQQLWSVFGNPFFSFFDAEPSPATNPNLSRRSFKLGPSWPLVSRNAFTYGECWHELLPALREEVLLPFHETHSCVQEAFTTLRYMHMQCLPQYVGTGDVLRCNNVQLYPYKRGRV